MTRLSIRRYPRTTATAAVALLLIAGLAAAKGKGILFPTFSQPSKGDFKKPAAEIGKKVAADEPWSVTTVTSSIMGQPVEGKPISVVGEIIDLSCYLQVGKHGDKHRDCGQKCARHGQPIGLLTEDGAVYMLIDEEHDPRRDGDTEFRKQAIDNMAYVVRVHGTYTDVDGQKAIYVTGTAKKTAKK
ncbi:MAG TPA: hypothetical protein VFW87_04525 [Pirellulales bacterium]|nr:hypothetical protein [Pirellulales bacterium]